MDAYVVLYTCLSSCIHFAPVLCHFVQCAKQTENYTCINLLIKVYSVELLMM